MSTAETTLKWEAERRRKVIIAAAVAAALPLIAAAWTAVIYQGTSTELVAKLAFQREHGPQIVAISVLQSLGFAALIYVLYYLFKAAQARQKQIPAAMLVQACIFIGPLIFSVGVTLFGINQWIDGNDFQSVAQTKAAAEEVMESGFISSIAPIFLSGALASIFAITATSLLAMKSGLLTRFMGIVGIVTGVTAPFLLTIPVLMSLWLSSLIIMLLGRSPNGTPLAWKTGKAEEINDLYQDPDRELED